MLNPEELAKKIASSFGASIASPIRGTIVINSDGTNPATVDEVGAFYVYVKLLNQPEIVTVEYDPNAISSSVIADGSPVLVQLKESGGYKLIGADMALVNADPSLYGGPSPYDFQHDHTETDLPLGTNSVTTNSITALAVTTAKIALLNITTGLIADTAVTNAKLAGTITVALGGTGRATLTANNLLAGNGTGTVNLIAPSTSGNILQSNGTAWASVAPSFNASVITAGTLAVARGGTGLGTLTLNNVILGNGTSTPLFVAPSTSGNVLTSNGTTWVSSAPTGGTGTVTSVGLTSTTLTITGSPITTSGTFTANLPVPATQTNTNSLYSIGGLSSTLRHAENSGTSPNGIELVLSRPEGTIASPTASTTGLTSLGDIVFQGYGTSYAQGAIIRAKNTELWTATAHGTQLEFHTTPNASITTAVALTLGQDKSATFASSVSATSLISSGAISGASANITGNVTADIFIADTTVGTNTGGLGYNSTNKALNAYTAGIEQYLGGILYRATANKTVASTASKVSLIPTSGVGTVTLPANFFTAGRMLRYTIRGVVQAVNTTDTLQFDLLLGGTSISLSTARARAITNQRGFEITGELVCYTTGVSGTITGGATYMELQPSYVNFVWTPATGVTVNTTGALAFDITAQWSASSASNSIIAYTFILEAL